MTGRARRRLAAGIIGWAMAVTTGAAFAARVPEGGFAHRRHISHHMHHRVAHPRPAAPPAADPVPAELDQRRRDGHMTPEERHLLRQHIEDAARELYQR